MTGLPPRLLGVDVYWQWEIIMAKDVFLLIIHLLKAEMSAEGPSSEGKGRLGELPSSSFAQQPLKELSEWEEGRGQKVSLHISKKRIPF